MTTPNPEAIQAAARAMFYQQTGLNPPYPLWDDADAIEKDNCRNDAQLALSAAYPLMEAQAKAEALREAVSDFESSVGVAEFEEQTRRDGRHHTHAYEAWDHQSAYMDWLRNRADQIESDVTP